MLKETNLKMEEKLLDVGWKTGSTHLEPVSLSVPPLSELSQWHTSYVSPANALVIVLALNAKCRVVLLASANGTIPNVENNGCDKSDTGDSEQSLRCD